MRTGRRILLVIETSGGGSGRHVLDLAKTYVHRGHDVHIAYSGRRMEPWFARALHTLEGIHSVRIDMRRAPHPHDFVAFRQLRSYLDRAGPFDVIHGHSSKGGAMARLAGIGRGGVHIYTPHAFRTLDPMLKPWLRVLYAKAERLLARLGHGVINVSEEERLHALDLGLPAEQLFVVSNGLTLPTQPATRAEIRAELGLEDNQFAIGFVGRLVAQKAPERLIVAFASLYQRYPQARLVMLGDGPLRISVRNEAERLGVAPAICWRSNGNGFRFMAGFDAFAMPSLYEAFPYVLIEAAASGLPLVATPVGGTDALIDHGKNGLIVPHAETNSLTDALESLIAQPELCRHMGIASRRRAAAFTTSAMADATLAVYDQLTRRCQRPLVNDHTP